jgi:hypothetical protein
MTREFIRCLASSLILPPSLIHRKTQPKISLSNVNHVIRHRRACISWSKSNAYPAGVQRAVVREEEMPAKPKISVSPVEIVDVKTRELNTRSQNKYNPIILDIFQIHNLKHA